VTIELYPPLANSDAGRKSLVPTMTPRTASKPGLLVIHESHAWFEITWTIGGTADDLRSAADWAQAENAKIGP
jgi:hypothetical protein